MLRIVHDGGTFRVHSGQDAGVWCVHIEGIIGGDTPDEELDGVFEGIHVATVGRPEVVVELGQLQHAGSGAVRALLRWLRRIEAEPRTGRYVVRVQSDPRHPWQRTSLRNLARMCGDVMVLTEK